MLIKLIKVENYVKVLVEINQKENYFILRVVGKYKNN